MKQDGEFIRRVVPSPAPRKILDVAAIQALITAGQIVICCGGGGIPVVAHHNGYTGVEAVIDKDATAALLAQSLEADYLLILTEADAVYQDWGTVRARALHHITAEELRPFAIPDGAMGPKAAAAIQFAQRTGKPAFIGALKDAIDILAGKKGTCVR